MVAQSETAPPHGTLTVCVSFMPALMRCVPHETVTAPSLA